MASGDFKESILLQDVIANPTRYNNSDITVSFGMIDIVHTNCRKIYGSYKSMKTNDFIVFKTSSTISNKERIAIQLEQYKGRKGDIFPVLKKRIHSRDRSTQFRINDLVVVSDKIVSKKDLRTCEGSCGVIIKKLDIDFEHLVELNPNLKNNKKERLYVPYFALEYQSDFKEEIAANVNLKKMYSGVSLKGYFSITQENPEGILLLKEIITPEKITTVYDFKRATKK